MPEYTLPELPYDYAALEPHYSAQILELHHDKHHAAYVEGRQHRRSRSSTRPAPRTTSARSTSCRRTSPSTSPATSCTRCSGRTSRPTAAASPRASSPRRSTRASAASTGSRPSSPRPRSTCRARAGARSTWEPLGQRLIVEQVYDHQSNVGQGGPPLLVLDMWEHAYYLQYKNVKADWVEAFWKIVNWPDVASRFEKARHIDSTLAADADDAASRGSAAADRREHGDLVAVGERGGVAVGRLVAVDPDARAVEDLAEAVAVAGARRVEQLAEGRRREVVRGAPGGLAGRREQQQADAQLVTSAGAAGTLGAPTVDPGELVLEHRQLGLERLDRPVAVGARIGSAPGRPRSGPGSSRSAAGTGHRGRRGSAADGVNRSISTPPG